MPDIVHWPFGLQDSQASKAFAAVIPATIVNNKTLLPLDQLTGAATLNLTLSDRLTPGAQLTLKASVDGTNRVLTFGTKLVGLAQTLLANKSYAIRFEFDGVNFLHISTQIQN